MKRMKRMGERVEGCAQHPTESVRDAAVGLAVVETSKKSVRCFLACLLMK